LPGFTTPPGGRDGPDDAAGARLSGQPQALIANLSPDDLARPTPCEGWDVRALINHLIAVNYGYAASVAGQPPPLDRLVAFTGRRP